MNRMKIYVTEDMLKVLEEHCTKKDIIFRYENCRGTSVPVELRKIPEYRDYEWIMGIYHELVQLNDTIKEYSKYKEIVDNINSAKKGLEDVLR